MTSTARITLIKLNRVQMLSRMIRFTDLVGTVWVRLVCPCSTRWATCAWVSPVRDVSASDMVCSLLCV